MIFLSPGQGFNNGFSEEEKHQEKSKKAEEKRTHKEEVAALKAKERAEKEELKAKAKNEKEQSREKGRLDVGEKHVSKDKSKGAASPLAVDGENTFAVVAEDKDGLSPTGGRAAAIQTSTASSESLKDSSDDEGQRVRGKSAEDDTVVSPTSPSNVPSRVKSWFAGRFHRHSKAGKDGDDGEGTKSGTTGGATLTGDASATEDKTREESMRDVAMAGKSTTEHTSSHPRADRSVSPIQESQTRQAEDSGSISSQSASGEETSGKDDKPRRGRLGFKERLLGKTTTDKRAPDDDADTEEYEEARDVFEEEKLAPPPRLTVASVTGKPSGSPVRDSKFSEDL